MNNVFLKGIIKTQHNQNEEMIITDPEHTGGPFGVKNK